MTMFILFALLVVGATNAQELIEGSGEEIEGSGEVPLVGTGTAVLLSREECPPTMDVVLLFDSSSSQKTLWGQNVEWSEGLLENMPVHRDLVRVSAIQYAGYPFTEFALNTYPTAENIISHLRGMSYRSGVTRTGAALRRAKIELFRETRGARVGARKVIMLFSDGLSIDDPSSVAAELRSLGVTIYVAAVSRQAYLPELLDIVGGDDGLIFTGDKLAALSTAVANLADISRLCPWDTPLVNSAGDVIVDYDHLSLDSAEVFSQYDDESTSADELYYDAGVTELKPKEPLEIRSIDVAPLEDTIAPTVFETEATTKTVSSTQRLTTATTQAPTTSSRAATTTTRAATTTTRAATTTTRTATTSTRTATTSTRAATTTPRATTTTPRATTTPRRTTTRRLPATTTTGSPSTTTVLSRRRANGPICALELLLVLDGSGSVQSEYANQKAFAESLLDQLEQPEQRGAVIQFAGERLQKTEIAFDSQLSHDSMMKRFTNRVRHFTGTTHLGKALDHARKVLDQRRRDAKSIMVIISDGYTQDDVLKPIDRLRAQHPNVEIYSVGLADLNNQVVLEQVAGRADHAFVGEAEAARLSRRLKTEIENC